MRSEMETREGSTPLENGTGLPALPPVRSTLLGCAESPSKRRPLLAARGSASEQLKDNTLNALSTGENGSADY